jgi:opacity protein-like surface antigen
LKKLTKIICVLLLLLLPSTSFAADEWEFAIIPYALFPFIEGDTTTGVVEDTNIDVSPADIFDALEAGGMIYLEAFHKNGFGGSLGYAFMDLSDDGSGPAGFTSAEIDIYQGIFEAYLYYRTETTKGPLDVFGGIRHWDIDIDLDYKGIDRSESHDGGDDWVDPIVGVRWMPQISEDWSLSLRGDIGGFGVGSDFTWNVQGGTVWDFADSMSLVVQYRALSVDYCDGTRGTSGRFCYDTITHGPIVGLAFRL